MKPAWVDVLGKLLAQRRVLVKRYLARMATFIVSGRRSSASASDDRQRAGRTLRI